jgi:hypothetical protein
MDAERQSVLAERKRYLDEHQVDPFDYPKYKNDGSFDGLDWGMVSSVIRRNREDATRGITSDRSFADVALEIDPAKGTSRIAGKVRPDKLARINEAVAKGILDSEKAAELETADDAVVDRQIAIGSGQRANLASYVTSLAKQVAAARANIASLNAVPEVNKLQAAHKEKLAKAQAELDRVTQQFADLSEGAAQRANVRNAEPAPVDNAQAPATADWRKQLAEQALNDPDATPAEKARAKEILGR